MDDDVIPGAGCAAASDVAPSTATATATIAARMVRRLLVPETGVALVAQSGLEVVGHALVESFDQAWNCELLVEDAWQGRGIGTMLVKSAAAHARSECAERMTFITAGSNDRLLKVIGAAGFVARVERHQDRVHITVPLSGVRAASAS